MSNCNNNCEAVSGLQEAAANLIQYRNLINKWLNGGINETVDIGGVSTPTLLNLAYSIRQLIGVHPDEQTITIGSDKKIKVKLHSNGGIKYDANGLYLGLAGSGIKIDQNGNLYLDLSDMPTDKFEALLKALRLPIWLTSDMNFYVDKSHPNASDNLDEGRGLSPEKPFLTIQNCANFIANNYNIGNYTANILVKGGTYTEKLVLPDFTKGTGSIYIRPVSSQDSVTLNMGFYINEYSEIGINVSGGNWVLDSLDYIGISNGDNIPTERNCYRHLFYINEGAIFSLFGPNITYNSSLNLNNTQNLYQWIFNSIGLLNFRTRGFTKNRNSSIKVINGSVSDKKRLQCFGGTGQISLFGDNDNQNFSLCNVTGPFSYFCGMENGGFFIRSDENVFMPNFMTNPANSVSGIRYFLASGGRVNTAGGGPDFFPGNQPGTIDEATYCWYI